MMLRMLKLLIVSLPALAIACGCAGPSKLPPELANPPVDTLAGEYHIGVDDQIQVTVWGNERLSVNMPVRPDGKISMPLIGDVEAGGLTAEEMSADIESKLAEFIRSPNVTVQITELRSHEYLSRIRIAGAVTSPISIPYRQGMTLLDAVLAAGGVTEFAAPGRTMLHRTLGEESKVYKINLERVLDGDVALNVELAPGDTITVPERLL